MARKREAEESRNREEVEKFEKKFKPRRKRKDKYENSKQSREDAMSMRKIVWILAIVVSFVAVTVVYATAFGSSVLGTS